MKAMAPYWTRVLAAWLLLKFASAVMKDAERLLKTTAHAEQIPPTDTAVVVEGGGSE